MKIFARSKFNLLDHLDQLDHIAITAMEATLRSGQAPALEPSNVRSSSVSAYDVWGADTERLASFCYDLARAMLIERQACIDTALSVANGTEAEDSEWKQRQESPEGRALAERLKRLEEANRRARSGR